MSWPASPILLTLVFLPTQNWGCGYDVYHCVDFTWLLGTEFISSCLSSKNFAHWDIASAPHPGNSEHLEPSEEVIGTRPSLPECSSQCLCAHLNHRLSAQGSLAMRGSEKMRNCLWPQGSVSLSNLSFHFISASQEPSEVGIFIILTIKMRKWKTRQSHQLAQEKSQVRMEPSPGRVATLISQTSAAPPPSYCDSDSFSIHCAQGTGDDHSQGLSSWGFFSAEGG